MKSRSTEIIVGAVTLIALAILVAVTVNLKSSTIFSRKYPAVAFFKDVKRLEEGASVYVHGVVRGDVRKIEPSGRVDYPVRVTMMLTNGTTLHSGAKPRLVTAGLIGETEINIEDPNPAGQVLGPKAELIGETFMDINDLLDESPEIIEDLQVTMKSISSFMASKDNQNAIVNILNSASSLTQTLSRTFGASSGDLTAAAHNLRVATERLNDMLLRADASISTVGRDLTSASRRLNVALEDFHSSFGVIVRRLDGVATRIDATAVQANRVFSSADKILGENRVNARQAIDGLSSASVHLSRILGRIDEGQGTLGEALIGPESFRGLTSSIDNLNQSLEIVQRLLEGIDRWLTGSARRDGTIEIPYEVPAPEPPARRNK